MADVNELEQVATALFAAAERNDWESFASHFAADAVIVQNIGTSQTIDQAIVSLPRVTADGTTLEYQNVRRVTGANSVTEMHDAVFTKPDGREIRLDICVVMQFDDNAKIVRADEYLDSGAAAALFA